MLALLRLDARFLLRSVRSTGWIVFLIATPALLTLFKEDSGEEPRMRWAWLAGMTGLGGMFGWFMVMAQLENLTALAPISVRQRTLHHVAIAGFMAVPTAGFCAWAAGPAAGLTAGLILFAGIVLFSAFCILSAGLTRWIQLPAAAVLFFAPPFALGAQIAFEAMPHALPASAAAAALLTALYVGSVRGVEMGGTWDMQTDVPPRARSVLQPPAPAPASLDRFFRPAPLWILFKAVHLRWFAFLYAAIVLGISCFPGAMITICLMSIPAVMWPLHVWSGFQASPLPRIRAGLVVLGPVFLLWITSLGLAAAGHAARRDTEFVWPGPDYVALGHPDGWDVANRLGLHGGAVYRLPEDPEAAAERTAHYLQRVFGLRVPPSDILALRPERTGRTSAEWLQAVEARYAPDIRRNARWLAACSALAMLLVLLVYASIYYLPSRHRTSWGTLILLSFAALNFVPALGREPLSTLFSVTLRDVAVSERWAVAAALAAACLLLVARHFVAFLRLEAGTLGWTVTSGAPSSS